MYDITLTIVTYNNSKMISKAIYSIINNISNDISCKFYIVDNNSTDNTIKEVEKIKGNIQIIKNRENVGFGAGHNKILAEIDSKYHLVVNPDIIIENNVINDMFRFMEKNKNIGLLTPLVKGPNDEIQYLNKREVTFADLFIRRFLPNIFKKRQDYFVMKDMGYEKPYEVEYATGCFMFFRTSIFKKIKGFDDNFFMYLEDADITKRVNEISKTMFFPYNFVVHEWQRGSHKNFKLMLINIQSVFYYFKKWGFKLY